MGFVRFCLRAGLGFLLVWFRVELLFRQGLFCGWFRVCFSAVRFTKGWLRVGLGFIQGRFRVYLGLV